MAAQIMPRGKDLLTVIHHVQAELLAIDDCDPTGGRRDLLFTGRQHHVLLRIDALRFGET